MTRSAFGGGDQGYLRDVQYRDSTNLQARARLHVEYSTAAVSWPIWLAGLVDWPAGGAVLEVGCGPGWFWAGAADALPSSLHITVSDLSAGMVAEALDLNRHHGYAAFAGEVCDAQDLPFPDESFDVVVADHMLYHVPDPDRAIAEIARVVRPQGLVLAATNDRTHLAELRAVVHEVFDTEPSDLFEVFGVESGAARLAARFGGAVWHPYANDLVVTNPDDVVAYIRSYPPGDAATPDQIDALGSAVAERFAADGTFRVRPAAGAFVARGPLSRPPGAA